METDTEAGTLSYSSPQTVYNRLSGTITWLPQIGQVIKQGQALYDIDGEPVILMNGTTPAYRDLTPGITDGADVLQLNRISSRWASTPMGSSSTISGRRPRPTASRPCRTRSARPRPADLTLGQIVFLPGDQLIASVDATLGSTGGGSGASATSTPVLTAQPEFVDLDAPGYHDNR